MKNIKMKENKKEAWWKKVYERQMKDVRQRRKRKRLKRNNKIE